MVGNSMSKNRQFGGIFNSIHSLYEKKDTYESALNISRSESASCITLLGDNTSTKKERVSMYDYACRTTGERLLP